MSRPKAPFTTLAELAVWLERTPEAQLRVPDGWTVAQVLLHCAQSIQYSMEGFPEPKPAWFRTTVGPLAAWVFLRRGYSSHGLMDAIPGAPALPQDATLAQGKMALFAAIQAFEAWQKPLHPHFAYGPLSRDAYTRLQAMHVANHFIF